MRATPLAIGLILAWVGTGCGGGDAPAGDSQTPAEGESPAASAGEPEVIEIYDREFLFAGVAPDSLVHVPWFFHARVRGDSVGREIQALLARGGGWEALAHEEWVAPIAPAPWRLLPGDRVRLTVGAEDRIDVIRLRDPAREVETRIGELITDWTRRGSDPARLFAGETDFPSGTVSGFVLEVNRRWERPGPAPGDWIFLHGGSLFQLFLEEQNPSDGDRTEGEYRGWSRIAFQNALWNLIDVSWAELLPFEPARRDIPHAWILNTDLGDLTGLVTAVSSHVEAGEGEGPLLPLSGFFAVEGMVTVRGESFPVVGVVRHRQD